MPLLQRRIVGWPARPSLRALGVSAVTGALTAAGQAPLGWWWLAVPALAAATVQVARADGASRRIWTGWGAGLGYFAATLFWIVEPFLVEPESYGWMAPFALVFMGGGMALFWALAAGFAGLGTAQGTRALGFAAGLSAADLLRSYLFTGFPWALVGHIWIGTPVAQAAAWFGPVGLTILTMLAVAVPVAAGGRIARPLAAAGAVLLLGALWTGGQVRLDQPAFPRDPAIRVRLIQPNATQALKWQGDMWQVFLDRQMEMTGRPSDRPLNLIVWPETAVPFLLDRTGNLFAEITALSGGVPVAAGVQRRDGERYFNSLAVTDGGGAVIDVYDKHHLVPFGEYIPGGDAVAGLGLTAFAARSGYGYSPGKGAAVLDLGRAGKVLPLICYEAVFPQDLNAAPGRADWILQITNDGWFGSVSGPYQHLAQARLRAIEQGLPFLRSANTGITAVIDAKGRLLRSLPLNTEGLIDADLPPALAPTVYARWGDLPATAVIAVALLGLAVRRRAVSH